MEYRIAVYVEVDRVCSHGHGLKVFRGGGTVARHEDEDTARAIAVDLTDKIRAKHDLAEAFKGASDDN